MQIANFDVADDRRKEAIFELLGDKYHRTILDSIMQTPKTALQISLETNIAATTVYRKLEKLRLTGLVKITGEINENGKKHFLYKSKVSQIVLVFSKDEIKVDLVF